jgi:hypothetical protein
MKALNDGSIASWTFVGDIFRVAFPGVGGGAPTTVFQIGNVNGTAKVALRGDMYIDGSISAQKMVVGTITAASAIIADAAISNAKIQDAAITYAKIADANIGYAKIIDLSVDTLKIAGSAITAPSIAFSTSPISGFEGEAYALSVSNTVTLEPGYPYYAVVYAWMDYAVPVFCSGGAFLYVNGGRVEGAQFGSEPGKTWPFVFNYALAMTGTGGPQTTSAQLNAWANYAGVVFYTKLLSIEIMKR